MKKILQQGFTLIELMLVVAIIGVLVAVAIPAYQQYITKSKLVEVFSIASQLKIAVLESYTLKKSCPINTGGAINGSSVLAPTEYSTAIINDITISTGTSGCDIDVTIKNDAPVVSSVKGKVISLKLLSNTSGAIAWTCASNMSPEDIGKYLPAMCNE